MTTHHIALKGALLAVKGELTSMSWRTAKRRAQAGGGDLSKTLDAQCAAMVACAGSAEAQLHARVRDVPIITEAQLSELFASGSLEWEEQPAFAVTATLDESIAALRAVFASAPTSAAWTRCLEIVEGCDPERIEDLITYAEPFVDAWSAASTPGWSPPEDHPLLAGAPLSWLEGLPKDELRVAPPLWIIEMARGEEHIKHALVRGLNLDVMGINGGLGANILANPHLRRVRWLNLGQARLPKTFYTALRTCELMRSVEELWLYAHPTHLDEARWTEPEHSFDALRSLRLLYLPFGHEAFPCLSAAAVGAPLIGDSSTRWDS